MKKILFTTIIASIILSLQSFSSHAQDIEGIKIGDKLTKEQIIQKLGEPKECKSGFDECYGNYQTYDYDGMSFLMQEDICISWGCDKNNIIMFGNIIDGGIQIGDDFDKIKKMSNHLTYKYDRYIDRFQYTVYVYLWTANKDTQIHFEVRDKKIVGVLAIVIL